MDRPRRSAVPLLAALALAATLALAACGSEGESKEVVEGQPVTLGELQYNVTFSRFLNPNDNEDSAYLVGQPPAPDGSSYFGVFLEVQNEDDEAHELPRVLTVHTPEGEEFEALESESLYAFPFGGEVEAEEQIPVLDSTPQQGPIEASLAIFLLPEEATENRPLIMEIPAESSPGEGDGPAEVTLDL